MEGIMTGKISVRSGHVKVHRRRYLRLEDVSVELTDEWLDMAEDIHTRFNDVAWRDTLERIIKMGLSEYQNRLIDLAGYRMEKELNE